jgi:hypothetical protein
MRKTTTTLTPPAVTSEEQAAQKALLHHAETLRSVRDDLQALHDYLGEPPDEEQMAEGTLPETVTFSIRGTIECLVSDRLDPAVDALERVARETSEVLYEEWAKRRGRVGVD